VISDIVGTLDMVLGAMFIAASIYGLITVLRSQRSSPEELERANMRSCPWPTGPRNDERKLRACSRR